MKRAIYFVGAMLLVTSSLSAQTDTNRPANGIIANRFGVTIQAPSDLLANGAKGHTPYGPDFVLSRLRDFRLMYCDSGTLERRVSSGVYVLDSNLPGGVQVERKVGTNAKLRDVLKTAGAELEHWLPGSQPKLRIISKYAILSDTGSTEFLETRISPGDFIVVTRTYD